MSLSHHMLMRRRAFIGLALLLLLLPLALWLTHSARASSGGKRSVIRGNLVTLLRNATPLRALDADRQLQLTIALQLRNQKQLDAQLQALEDPRSPLYHHYLTPQEFTRQFGLHTGTVEKVAAYLRAQDLTVDAISPNNMLINASGTVAAIEKAFAVTLESYAFEGRTVYAPMGEPSVPASLAGTILNVGGLDNVARYHPLLRLKHVTGPDKGFSPTDMRTAYDISPLVSTSNGAGQTVALFELDGYNPGDVNAYLTQYNLGAPNYSNVLVDNALNVTGTGAIEVELDMEIMSAIAPGAAQKVYIGPNSSSGLLDTYNQIVTDDAAKVVSISWGMCEANSSSAQLTALDNIFKQGAAQGQAFFAASGDSGAYDCSTDALSVDSPSDDPHVIGTGGTNLTLGDGSSYGDETAWSSTTEKKNGSKGAGSGGGYSTVYSKPSYQSGPGVDDKSMRHVPDVSADADPATGYAIYCTVIVAGCSPSGWVVVGGTSAAAPLWSGIAVDTNGYLLSQKKSTLGNASSRLYQLFNTKQTFSAFHDITSGDNLYYKAGPGYDLATGIGTPDAWNLARDLAADLPGSSPPPTPPAPPASTPTPVPTPPREPARQ